ncbi:MAG: AMP-binding protein, partial [Candidatus Sumerlaeales bacterium]|nr:AMP-binding protein [Candidatus Sumerlaeales bacterium]
EDVDISDYDFDKIREEVSIDDLATIVYTSGTTGIPKGVMLTHSNLISQLIYLDAGLRDDYPPGLKQLAMLPAWHAYERMAEYFLTYQIIPTLYYTSKRHLKRDIVDIQPAVIPCVPRIWEMIFENIRTQVSKQSPFKQKMFHFFVDFGKLYIYCRRKAFNLELRKVKRSILDRAVQLLFVMLLYPLYKFADVIVFKKIRNTIATHLVAAISGGGSLSPYIDDFFETIGIVLLNGYGLSETSPVIAVRSLKHNVRGSVGRVAEKTDIEIRSEDGVALPQGKSGQIWIRGPQVMKGYYKNEEETRKVLVDGWFNTGDLGWLSCTGDLVISGRAKDTIVLSSGENIEPEPIEGMLRESPLIADLVVIGQDRKSLSALVIPDMAYLAEALNLPPETSPKDIVANSKATQLVKQEIVALMKEHGGFKAHEMIQQILLLDEPFTEANGLLTQTLKPKRNPISKRYAEEIDKLYR